MSDEGEHTLQEGAATSLLMSGVSSRASSVPARVLDSGERVGRYVVQRPIGAGGMGTVYLAHDPDLDRPVALKILHSTGDRAARERLLREAQATARLAHPNVVSVHDVGSFEDGTFVALEYVQGGTLRRWLRQEGRRWPQIVRALIHAGRGLAAAHDAGLVHRDFKPDNVLIGADGRVRVADFGLAGQIEVTSEASAVGELLDVDGRSIQAGLLAGTPGYMAPEQLRGLEVDARSDVFAFGVTLWEALAGERPFGGVTFIEHVSHVLQGRLRPFPRDTAVPIQVIRAIQRALCVDPAERWQSVQEFLDVLGASIDASASSSSHVRPFGEEAEVTMPAALGVRYQLLEGFAGGSLGPIYRARDRLEGLLVAVKRTQPLRLPKTREGDPSPRVVVAGELRRRLALRHPNIVGILDFGFDEEEVAFFVLDLPDAAQPLLSAARDAPRAIQIHLVGQLLRALIYLHERARVGVRLDAQSVVVVGDVLKVIDTEWFDDDDERGAPLAAAPEVAAGGPRSVAGDLFAVGVLIAGLIDGERSLDESWQAALLSASRAGQVARTLRVEGPFGDFLGRLLAADPRARPRSATEALAMLAEATGIDLPAETVHTRESFLQAGALVGRERALETLTEALRGCLRGRSRVIAVAGESGIGKSRLVDEVRALGLVFGAVVLRGHASREGGRLFEAWRPLLRWLVISTPLSDLEASVLRIGVPDIDLLLGRAVPSAPPLDAASAQLRLLQVLLGILRRQVRTLVVLIEDLHWARRESLDLLMAIVRELDGLRLLVVVTYRDDETPHLLEEIPEIERIRLGRLDRPGIAAVAEAMLGEGGRRPGLVELLTRETEGNALFVVEVMRSLAEEAGTLAAIGSRPLPTTIAAGGIQRVIQRRIARLSPPTRRFLEIAAVIGRDLDPELMAIVAADLDLEVHVAEAAEAAALEREGAGWRFAHEKIRESLLAQLSDERRLEIHGMVAEALEESSGDDRDRAEALALHFRAIGRHDKELVHVARAGERVVATSPEVGAALLERAVNLGRVQGAGALDLARWQRQIADARFNAGDMAGAVEEARRALAILGLRLPRKRLGWLLLLATQLLVQLLHVVHRPGGGGAKRERYREAARIVSRATQVYVYTFERLPLMAASLRAVNLAQGAGYTEPRATAFLAYTAALLGRDGLAERYFAEGLAGAERSEDVVSVADLRVMAAVFRTSRGEFPAAVELGRSALEVSRASGYALGIAQAEGILGCVAYLRGDLPDFHAAYRRAVEALRGAGHGGHARGVEWGLCWALAELGRDDEALLRVEALRGETPASERLQLSMIHGLRASVLARRGELEGAVAAADETMRHADARSVPGNAPIILAGPAEAYLAAWEELLGSEPARAAELRAKVREQLQTIRHWARLNPIGRPLVDLLRGQIAFLDGNPADAQAFWTAALGQAEALGLRLWQGRAHLSLALYGDRRERDRHRAAAEHLLRRCGADFRLGPLGRYRALLSSTVD